MSAHLDCYSTIYGLSRTDCNCFTTGIPWNVSDSDSGLYLDEVEGLSLEVLKNVGDCVNGSLWELMERARASSILSYKTDLMNYIGQRTLRRRQSFSGMIGDDRWNTRLQLSENFAGLTWQVAPVRSGFMRFKGVGMLFDSAGAFDVILYDNQSNTPLATWNVTAAQTTMLGQVTWFRLPTPLSLPLYDSSKNYLRYWLIYIPSTAPNPKDNRLNCGCGNLPSYNVWSLNSPQFKSMNPPNAKYNWFDWAIMKGTRGNLLTQREQQWLITEEMHGLVIDADFICKNEDIICKDLLDYDNDELSMVQAYCTRYKAAEILIELILSSPKPNRFTLLDRERLWGKRNHYRKEYDGRIEYIGDQLTEQNRINLISDCLACKNIEGFKKIGIRVT